MQVRLIYLPLLILIVLWKQDEYGFFTNTPKPGVVDHIFGKTIDQQKAYDKTPFIYGTPKSGDVVMIDANVHGIDYLRVGTFMNEKCSCPYGALGKTYCSCT